MNMLKKFTTLLLVLVMVLAMSATAFAAGTDSTITFKGSVDGFAFAPGSTYTATDLFDNFKGVMPGDKLTETVKITNEAADCDYINLYMKAVVHDEEGNPLSENVAESETVASMQKFLSQLTMRIYNGDKLIYEASPDKAGALVDNVLLGKLLKNESLNLKVELDVPVTLGNEFANRVGEVDWVFLAECIQFEKLTVHKVWEDNGYPERPTSVKVHLLRDGKKFEEVVLNKDNQWTYTWDDLDDRHQWTVEEEVPTGYEVSYKTEDNKVFITNSMDYVPVVPPEPVNITAKKVWSDDNNKLGIRPDSVVVTLYNGKTAVDRVALGAWNNWTYSWKELDGSGDWSVVETGIAKGYTPSYRTSGEVVTITNTATLIQTGQLNWPIPVLGFLGVMMIFCGIVVMSKKRKSENA